MIEFRRLIHFWFIFFPFFFVQFSQPSDFVGKKKGGTESDRWMTQVFFHSPMFWQDRVKRTLSIYLSLTPPLDLEISKVWGEILFSLLYVKKGSLMLYIHNI